MTSRFNPSADEVRKRREDTGCGLVDAKRELLRRNMTAALERVDAKSENERTLRDVLLTMLEQGMVR